jgi:hypothetical protein
LKRGDLLVIARAVSGQARQPAVVNSVAELLGLSQEIRIPKLFVHLSDEASKYHSRRRLETFGSGRKKPKLARHLHSTFISCREGANPDRLQAYLWLPKEFARLLW